MKKKLSVGDGNTRETQFGVLEQLHIAEQVTCKCLHIENLILFMPAIYKELPSLLLFDYQIIIIMLCFKLTLNIV